MIGEKSMRAALGGDLETASFSVRFDINTSMSNELLPTRKLYISKHK